MTLIYSLHVLTASLWVGGMFFAYLILRPVAAKLLEPETRLELWSQSFQRFFKWVTAFAVILPITGYGILGALYQGQSNSSINLMQVSGWLMIAIFCFIYFKPYKKMQHFLIQKKLPAAANCLNLIRKLIALNLFLGILTIIIATGSSN